MTAGTLMALLFLTVLAGSGLTILGVRHLSPAPVVEIDLDELAGKLAPKIAEALDDLDVGETMQMGLDGSAPARAVYVRPKLRVVDHAGGALGTMRDAVVRELQRRRDG